MLIDRCRLQLSSAQFRWASSTNAWSWAESKCGNLERMPAASRDSVLMLSAHDVQRVFSSQIAIQSQREAFTQLACNAAILPERLTLDGPAESVAFCYAARLSADSPAVCKFGSVNPANAQLDLPSVSALITVLDPHTGRPVAIMDGTSITTLRTAAGTALAVQELARPDDDVLAIIGSGVQAKAHIAALSATRTFRQIRLAGRDTARTEALAESISGADVPVVVCSAQEAVAAAQIVVTATTSSEPVIENEWVAPGSTVISIGSFTADHHEVPQDFVHRCDLVVVDDLDTALHQAGPVRQAVADGVLERNDISTIGQVCIGERRGRTGLQQVVYCNSVGLGIQDAAAAGAILQAARAAGVGIAVTI